MIAQPHDMENALSRFDIHYTLDPLCARLWALEAHYHIELIDKQQWEAQYTARARLCSCILFKLANMLGSYRETNLEAVHTLWGMLTTNILQAHTFASITCKSPKFREAKKIEY